MDTHSPKLKSALDLVIDFLLARSEELVEVRALDALSPATLQLEVGEKAFVDVVVDGLPSDPQVFG